MNLIRCSIQHSSGLAGLIIWDINMNARRGDNPSPVWHNNRPCICKKITMDIIIQSLGFTAGETLENFIREKVSGLKSDGIVRANVTLYKGPAGNPENDYCEIRLEVPGNDHFVKRNSPYFETSVSECADILNQSVK